MKIRFIGFCKAILKKKEREKRTIFFLFPPEAKNSGTIFQFVESENRSDPCTKKDDVVRECSDTFTSIMMLCSHELN